MEGARIDTGLCGQRSNTGQSRCVTLQINQLSCLYFSSSQSLVSTFIRSFSFRSVDCSRNRNRALSFLSAIPETGATETTGLWCWNWKSVPLFRLPTPGTRFHLSWSSHCLLQQGSTSGYRSSLSLFLSMRETPIGVVWSGHLDQTVFDEWRAGMGETCWPTSSTPWERASGADWFANHFRLRLWWLEKDFRFGQCSSSGHFCSTSIHGKRNQSWTICEATANRSAILARCLDLKSHSVFFFIYILRFFANSVFKNIIFSNKLFINKDFKKRQCKSFGETEDFRFGHVWKIDFQSNVFASRWLFGNFYVLFKLPCSLKFAPVLEHHNCW